MGKTILYLVVICLFSCIGKVKENNKDNEKVTDEISFNKLDIQKNWIEINKINNEWVFMIPCEYKRELKTISITHVDNKEAIICNFGIEKQWYQIKGIKQQGDSTCFATVLPYDTTETEIFSMKYLDKNKNIVRWITDEEVVTFIPTPDTIKYKRIIQHCNDVINDDN